MMLTVLVLVLAGTLDVMVKRRHEKEEQKATLRRLRP